MEEHEEVKRNKFEVVFSSTPYGRYLRATEDIRPNEVIIDYDPVLLICPKVMNSCIECMRITNEVCDNCNFFLCKKCLMSKRVWHTQSECLVLRQRLSIEKPSLKEIDLHCLYIIRAWFQLDTAGQSGWSFLSSNVNRLNKRLHVWISLHDRLFQSYSLQISREELYNIIGLRRVNAKSLCMDRGFGIFSNFSLINHSCVSNAFPIVKSDFHLELYAKCFIEKGSEISVTYAQCDETLGQPTKRDILFHNWDFICTCDSCMKPSGSLSGVRCIRCSGFSYPIQGNEPQGKWVCDLCGAIIEEEEIKLITEDLNMLHQDHYFLSTSHPFLKVKKPTQIQSCE